MSNAAIVIIRANALTGSTEAIVYNPYALTQQQLSSLVGKAAVLVEDGENCTCTSVSNSSI